jgi:hypothetical protein
MLAGGVGMGAENHGKSALSRCRRRTARSGSHSSQIVRLPLPLEPLVVAATPLRPLSVSFLTSMDDVALPNICRFHFEMFFKDDGLCGCSAEQRLPTLAQTASTVAPRAEELPCEQR